MSKIKRNDPCPCGSGKKYKQCCLNKDQHQVHNHELEKKLVNVHEKMLRQTTIPQPLKEDIESYIEQHYPIQWNSNNQSIFYALLSSWAPFEYKTSNEETFIHQFIEREKLNVDVSARSFLPQWEQGSVALYQVIERHENEKIVIQQLNKDNTYEVVRIRIPVQKNDLIIGRMLTLGESFTFTQNFVRIPAQLVPSFLQQVDQFLQLEKKDRTVEELIHHHYPSFILMVIKGIETIVTQDERLTNEDKEASTFNWESEKQEEVAQEIMNIIDKEMYQVSKDYILNIWKAYCERRKPVIRKTGVFVAALMSILEQTKQETVWTQKSLAERFDVSSQSVAKRMIDFDKFMYEELQSYFETGASLIFNETNAPKELAGLKGCFEEGKEASKENIRKVVEQLNH